MHNPEKLATISTQDRGRRQIKNNKHHVLRNIVLLFSHRAGDYKAKAFSM